MARGQRAFGRRPKKVEHGITMDVFVAKDGYCLSRRALIDPDANFYIKIDSYSAVDAVNNIRADMTHIGEQSIILLDMQIDGKRQKDLCMAVTQLNQQYDMILGRDWLQRSQVRLEEKELIWLKDIQGDPVTSINQDQEEETTPHRNDSTETRISATIPTRLQARRLSYSQSECIRLKTDMSLEILGEKGVCFAPVNIGYDEENLRHLNAVFEPELDCLAIISLTYLRSLYRSNDLPMISLREEYRITGIEGENLEISHAIELYLEFDGLQERIIMLVADLMCGNLILGRRWRADRDWKSKDLKDIEDECLCSEVREEGLVTGERVQQIRRLEVSKPEFLEDFDILLSNKDYIEEIRDESQWIDDAIYEIRESEDDDQENQKDSTIPNQGINLLDVSVEDAKTAPIIMMQSHDIYENCEQELVENQESDVTISFENYEELTPICQEGVDFYRFGTSVVDDNLHFLRPFIRLPRKDNRSSRLDDRFSITDSEPPVNISTKAHIDMDEDVTRPTVRFPGNRNEDISVFQKLDELSDELANEDPCRSRIMFIDDQYIGLPSVRFPMDDYRLPKLNDGVRIPEVSTDTLNDRTTINGITIAIGPVIVVRLPERQDLLLFSSPEVEKTKKGVEETDKELCPYILSIDPVVEACLVEAAWREEIVEPKTYHEDWNSDDIPDDKDNLDFELCNVAITMSRRKDLCEDMQSEVFDGCDNKSSGLQVSSKVTFFCKESSEARNGTFNDQSDDNGFDDCIQILEGFSEVDRADQDCESVGEPPDQTGRYLRASVLDEVYRTACPGVKTAPYSPLLQAIIVGFNTLDSSYDSERTTAILTVLNWKDIGYRNEIAYPDQDFYISLIAESSYETREDFCPGRQYFRPPIRLPKASDYQLSLPNDSGGNLTVRIPEHPVITMRDDQIISGKDNATGRPIMQLSDFLQCDEPEESCKKSCLATAAWNEALSHWASNRSLEFGVFFLRSPSAVKTGIVNFPNQDIAQNISLVFDLSVRYRSGERKTVAGDLVDEKTHYNPALQSRDNVIENGAAQLKLLDCLRI